MSDHTPIPDTAAWLADGTPVIVDDDLPDPDDLNLVDLPPVVNDHPEG